MVVTRLVDRDAHVLEGCGPAVSLRFMVRCPPFTGCRMPMADDPPGGILVAWIPRLVASDSHSGFQVSPGTHHACKAG